MRHARERPKAVTSPAKCGRTKPWEWRMLDTPDFGGCKGFYSVKLGMAAIIAQPAISKANRMSSARA